MLVITGRLRPIGQHDRITSGNPVHPAQPRVVEHRFIFEQQQSLLVDRASQNVQQRGLYQHDNSSSGFACPLTTGASAGCLAKTTTAAPAAAMPPSLSSNSTGSAGSRSPN